MEKLATLQDNSMVRLSFPFDWPTINLVKTLDGRRYVAQGRFWICPLSRSNVDALLSAGFSIEAGIHIALEELEQKDRELDSLTKQSDTEFETALPLLPYQKVGAKFIRSIGSGLLGDDVGLGKTIQSLAVAEDFIKNNKFRRRILILCPAILKYQWESEIKEKFIPQATVQVIDGTKKQRHELWRDTQATYTIANYELLLHDFMYIERIEWDMIIADEATRIANHAGKQTRALKRLRGKYRLAMTGTPISNHPHELWSILDFANPGCLGNYYQFINRYCLKDQWGSIIAYQNMDELSRKVARYMIRRRKEDVLPELPDKVTTDVVFKLSDQERQLQKKLKEEVLFEIDKSDLSKVEDPMSIQLTLVKMTRLRQLADSLELLGENKKSTKLEVLQELLLELSGKNIIVFSEFAEMCKILQREIGPGEAQMIIGEVSIGQRQEVLDWFNSPGTGKVLIMSSAGAYGLNLQAAEVVINYDMPWSLSKLEQRTGRAHRMGQKNKVLVYNLLAKSSLDCYIKKVVMDKQQLSSQLLGDPQITMADIREMLIYEE